MGHVQQWAEPSTSQRQIKVDDEAEDGQTHARQSTHIFADEAETIREQKLHPEN